MKKFYYNVTVSLIISLSITNFTYSGPKKQKITAKRLVSVYKKIGFNDELIDQLFDSMNKSLAESYAEKRRRPVLTRSDIIQTIHSGIPFRLSESDKEVILNNVLKTISRKHKISSPRFRRDSKKNKSFPQKFSVKKARSIIYEGVIFFFKTIYNPSMKLITTKQEEKTEKNEPECEEESETLKEEIQSSEFFRNRRERLNKKRLHMQKTSDPLNYLDFDEETTVLNIKNCLVSEEYDYGSDTDAEEYYYDSEECDSEDEEYDFESEESELESFESEESELESEGSDYDSEEYYFEDKVDILSENYEKKFDLQEQKSK